MSVTSFRRRHFKAATAMSPLQYQGSSGCRRPGTSCSPRPWDVIRAPASRDELR